MSDLNNKNLKKNIGHGIKNEIQDNSRNIEINKKPENRDKIENKNNINTVNESERTSEDASSYVSSQESFTNNIGRIYPNNLYTNDAFINEQYLGNPNGTNPYRDYPYGFKNYNPFGFAHVPNFYPTQTNTKPTILSKILSMGSSFLLYVTVFGAISNKFHVFEGTRQFFIGLITSPSDWPQLFKLETWKWIFYFWKEFDLKPALLFNNTVSAYGAIGLWTLILPLVYYLYQKEIARKTCELLMQLTVHFINYLFQDIIPLIRNNIPYRELKSIYLNILGLLIAPISYILRTHINLLSNPLYKTLSYLAIGPLTLLLTIFTLLFMIPIAIYTIAYSVPLMFSILLFIQVRKAVKQIMADDRYINSIGHNLMSMVGFILLIRHMPTDYDDAIFNLIPNAIIQFGRMYMATILKVEQKLGFVSADLDVEGYFKRTGIDEEFKPIEPIKLEVETLSGKPHTVTISQAKSLKELEFEKAKLIKWYLSPIIAASAKIVHAQRYSFFHTKKMLTTFASNRAHKVILTFLKKIAYNQDGTINKKVEDAFTTLDNSVRWNPYIQIIKLLREEGKYGHLADQYEAENFPLGINEVVNVLGKVLGIIQPLNSRRLQNLTYIQTITRFLKNSYKHYRKLVDQADIIKYGVVNDVPAGYLESIQKALKDGLISKEQFESMVKTVEDVRKRYITKNVDIGSREKAKKIFNDKLKLNIKTLFVEIKKNIEGKIINFKCFYKIIKDWFEKHKSKSVTSNNIKSSQLNIKTKLNQPRLIVPENNTNINSLNKPFIKINNKLTDKQLVSINNKMKEINNKTTDLFSRDNNLIGDNNIQESPLVKELREKLKVALGEVKALKEHVNKQNDLISNQKTAEKGLIDIPTIESEVITVKTEKGILAESPIRKVYKLDSSPNRYQIEKQGYHYFITEYKPKINDADKAYVECSSTLINNHGRFSIKNK